MKKKEKIGRKNNGKGETKRKKEGKKYKEKTKRLSRKDFMA